MVVPTSSDPLPPPPVVPRWGLGDALWVWFAALAVAVVDRLAEWAGWFAAALTAVVDPEAIVLAGSIGAREPLAQRVAEHLDRFAPTTPRLVVSALGDGSVLAGAVALASAQALVRRLDERRRPA